jgi:hypothetical protein
MTQAELPEPLKPLAELLVRDGVSIGRLSPERRQLVFAMAWAGLPHHEMTERESNAALTARLSGPLVFVDTNHVELRRWLVDTGWLARDRYGRVYRRVEPAALPVEVQSLAASMTGLDTETLASDLRASHASRRLARRQTWAALASTPSAPMV